MITLNFILTVVLFSVIALGWLYIAFRLISKAFFKSYKEELSDGEAREEKAGETEEDSVSEEE